MHLFQLSSALLQFCWWPYNLFKQLPVRRPTALEGTSRTSSCEAEAASSGDTCKVVSPSKHDICGFSTLRILLCHDLSDACDVKAPSFFLFFYMAGASLSYSFQWSSANKDLRILAPQLHRSSASAWGFLLAVEASASEQVFQDLPSNATCTKPFTRNTPTRNPVTPPATCDPSWIHPFRKPRGRKLLYLPKNETQLKQGLESSCALWKRSFSS